jgi:hypothetical protein
MILYKPYCPIVSISADNTTICSGTMVELSATTIYEGIHQPHFEWYVNGLSVGSDSNTYKSDDFENEDIIYCILTGSTCGPRFSNVIQFKVSESCTPSITIAYFVVKSNSDFTYKDGEYTPSPLQSVPVICSGDTVIFSGVTVCGGGNPQYTWYKKQSIGDWEQIRNVTGTTYAYKPKNGDQIKVDMISSNQCASPSSVSSNTIGPLTVNDLKLVSVTVSPTGLTQCTSVSTVFTATPTNGGTTPVYKWYKNTTMVQSGSTNTYTYSPTTNDRIYCQLTANMTCAIMNPAVSNVCSITINPDVQVQVEIESVPRSVSTICYILSGQTSTFATTELQGLCGGDEYQWRVNGTNSSTNHVYTFYPNHRDEVELKISSTCPCNDGPEYSNMITVEYTSNTGATISIISDHTEICDGSPVSFTGVTYGFTSPTYQWKIDGSNVGSNSPYFSSSSLSDGNSVTCTATQGITTKTSNTISITVVTNRTPTVGIWVEPGTTVCQFEGPIFYVTGYTYGGNNPSFQWKKNGNNVGYNQTTYQPTTDLTTGDVITCVMTSNYSCLTTTTATSNSITMTVYEYVTPSVTITVNPGCLEESNNFTAHPVDGGTTPVYQWYAPGVGSGVVATGSAWNGVEFVGINPTEQIWCVMTSSEFCRDAYQCSSNILTIGLCSGTTMDNLFLNADGYDTTDWNWDSVNDRPVYWYDDKPYADYERRNGGDGFSDYHLYAYYYGSSFSLVYWNPTEIPLEVGATYRFSFNYRAQYTIYGEFFYCTSNPVFSAPANTGNAQYFQYDWVATLDSIPISYTFGRGFHIWANDWLDIDNINFYKL